MGLRRIVKEKAIFAIANPQLGIGSDRHQFGLEKLQAAPEKAGIEFIPEKGGGPGIRLAKP